LNARRAVTAPTFARLIFHSGSSPLNVGDPTSGRGDCTARAASRVENMIVDPREAGAT